MAKKQGASKSSVSSTERDWTFMVYMAADQSRDMDAVAVRDLKEMERGCKGNERVHVVVLLDRPWPGAQMYEIRGDGSRIIGRQLPADTNMGDGKTLSNFVSAIARSPKYRAKHYCLILWGHAYGLGFGRDHDDPLLLSELKTSLTAFKNARAYRRPKTDGRLEILGANTCSMSYVEAAFELRDCAELMLASQITVPFAGWPYDVILQRINDATDVDALARLIVDAYVTQFNDLPGADRLAMTVLDLAGAKGLDEALENLAGALADAIASAEFSSDLMTELRDLFMGSAAGDVRPLIDLTTLLRSLLPEGETPLSKEIKSAAQALIDILHGIRAGQPKLVRAHKCHSDLDDLNGIGVYAPFITDKGIIERLELSETPHRRGGRKLPNGREHYERLDIFPKREKAAWPKLVYDDLRRTIPADLIHAIDGISELQAGDRADVAQIIMSIESGLNQFDRAIAKAKRGVDNALSRSSTTPVTSAPYEPPEKPVPAFSAPWLQLIAPVPLETLERAKRLQELVPVPTGSSLVKSIVSLASPSPMVSTVVTHLARVEKALALVERITRRGLTHARFGLGLLAPNPGGFGLDPPKSGDGLDPPKSGDGLDPPKSGDGLDPPKSGDGLDPPKSGDGLPGDLGSGGDLRVDRGMRRVADLFVEVGRSMQDLERSVAAVEHVSRSALVMMPLSAGGPDVATAAASQQIGAAFLALEEASARARRVIRRVLAHPIYGLGPGEGQLTFDVRQELASRGGLDRRRLKLL